MENLINEIIDAPKMVSDKIPGNITSMVQGSDGNISKWVGMFYRVAATLFILGALYNLASPFMGRRSASFRNGSCTYVYCIAHLDGCCISNVGCH